MRHLLPSIRQLWNRTFTRAGLKPHPLWMINSTNEIPHRIQLLNRKFKIESAPSFNINFSTYDVKTLYTNLPQDDILEKLTQLFNEISRLKNPSAPSSTIIEVNRLGIKILKSHPPINTIRVKHNTHYISFHNSSR